jgi:hypothetical protein
MTLAAFGEDIDAMILLVDRALAFPSYARGWHMSSFLRLWAGQTDVAIEHAAMALRLSPRAQAGMTSFLGLMGAALFFSRRFEGSQGYGLRSRTRRFSTPPIVFLQPAMPMRGCSTRRAQRSPGYAGSRLR